jgi:hypothetical protein
MPLVMTLTMSLFVSVIIFQEEVFVSAVYRKCHCRNTQAGEAALKSIPSCERSVISPCLSVDFISIIALLPMHLKILREIELTVVPMDHLLVCLLLLRMLLGRSP